MGERGNCSRPKAASRMRRSEKGFVSYLGIRARALPRLAVLGARLIVMAQLCTRAGVGAQAARIGSMRGGAQAQGAGGGQEPHRLRARRVALNLETAQSLTRAPPVFRARPEHRVDARAAEGKRYSVVSRGHIFFSCSRMLGHSDWAAGASTASWRKYHQKYPPAYREPTAFFICLCMP